MKNSHFAAEMLTDLAGVGGLDDVDFGDFVELAAEAAKDPVGMAGSPAPEGYDPGDVYEALVSDRVVRDMQRSTERISGYFAARDAARHASAREGVMAASGASAEAYDAALAADAEGDPSPLLAMRTKYMSTI